MKTMTPSRVTKDNLTGNAGDDLLDGEYGNDLLDGGDGNDQSTGGLGNDSFLGGNGKDTLQGDDGDDTLKGDSGDDSLKGGLGKDNLTGNAGNDILTGDGGDDSLSGNQGNDLHQGGAGKDTLTGWSGLNEKDTLIGGQDSDIYSLANASTIFYNGDRNSGYATIRGLASGDKINLEGSASKYTLNKTQNYGGTATKDTAILTTAGDLIGVIEDNTNLITSLTSTYFSYL